MKECQGLAEVLTRTKKQNELYSEVWKEFSQGSSDIPALLPSAMLHVKIDLDWYSAPSQINLGS